MDCPYCGRDDSEVIETRDGGMAIRRRRECKKCGKRFTTFERVEEVNLVVIKKDGRREKFSREKLKAGLVKATEKRMVSMDLLDQVVGEIEQELRQKDTIEVSSKTIGNMVLRKLRKIDKVAYVRFASVYLDFETLEDFEKIVIRLT